MVIEIKPKRPQPGIKAGEPVYGMACTLWLYHVHQWITGI